jgi:uncharacterized phage-associated protein
MDKKDIILIALASGKDVVFSPVQIQKLLFLIDKTIPNLQGSPFFNFVPYDFGPFDKEIYWTLEELKSSGDVVIDYNPAYRMRRYKATEQGYARGEKLINSLNGSIGEYIKRLSSFVRSLSFGQLISAIYRSYPEMKSNSIFKD